MRRPLSITSEGRFELSGQRYHIPADFSPRQVFSYKRLLEPIPDIPGGTSLSDEQRSRQRAYFLRRAVACIVPGLQMKALEGLPDRKVRALHRWISRNRPALAEAYHEVSLSL